MMTDKDTLNKLFDAALKAPEPESKSKPKPSSPPTTRSIRPANTAAVRVASVEESPFKQTVPIAKANKNQGTKNQGTSAIATANKPDVKTQAMSSDQASSETKHDDDEVAKALEEKLNQETSRNKRSALINIVVVVAVVGGSTGWFFSSAERRSALFSSASEMRNAVDPTKMAEKYNDSLDKVAARGSQLDQATAAMGGSTELADGEDEMMDKEMQGMMGGSGKTLGDRNKQMKNKFGKMADDAGGVYQPKAELDESNSFTFE